MLSRQLSLHLDYSTWRGQEGGSGGREEAREGGSERGSEGGGGVLIACHGRLTIDLSNQFETEQPFLLLTGTSPTFGELISFPPYIT